MHPGVLRTDAAWVALRSGDRKLAEEVYAETKALVRAGDVTSSALLLLAVSLGRLDEAFAALNTAIHDRNPELLNLQSDPRLQPLRSDARYVEAVRLIIPAKL